MPTFESIQGSPDDAEDFHPMECDQGFPNESARHKVLLTTPGLAHEKRTGEEPGLELRVCRSVENVF
jgi:hypothetical protein